MVIDLEQQYCTRIFVQIFARVNTAVQYDAIDSVDLFVKILFLIEVRPRSFLDSCSPVIGLVVLLVNFPWPLVEVTNVKLLST